MSLFVKCNLDSLLEESSCYSVCQWLLIQCPRMIRLEPLSTVLEGREHQPMKTQRRRTGKQESALFEKHICF